MKLYECGQITWIGKNYIILENNHVGYNIIVAAVTNFQKGTQQKVYLYRYRNEYVDMLYGFTTFGARIFFEDLIKVPGIGPKTALLLMQKNYKVILKLIAQGALEEITQYPYIGLKIARQLVFDLQPKYQKQTSVPKTSKVNLQIVDQTLLTLGFAKKQIATALGKIDQQTSTETAIESAIRLISNDPS